MSQSLNHARHNRKACDHLHTTGEFPDWVITTSFYCAMHYALAIIFPFDEDGISYTSIEQYYNSKDFDNKHYATLHLITRKHFAIAEKYKQLKDVAHTARYHDYDHPPVVVSKMRRNLEAIQDYAEKKHIEQSPPQPTSSTQL
jgi:hypothetical protein